MAIIIDNPVLERQLRQAAEARGVTPEDLLVSTLRESGTLPEDSMVSILTQRLAKYRGAPGIAKTEYDALYEPLG